VNSLVFFLFAMWLPWNWDGLVAEMSTTTVWCHEAPPPAYPARIAWYEERFHIVHIVDCDMAIETQRRYVHELQHHLAAQYHVGDWEAFVLAIQVESTSWNEHQKNSVEWIAADGGGQELHADLPWLLDGEIPSSLQSWYPWFDLD